MIQINKVELDDSINLPTLQQIPLYSMSNKIFPLTLLDKCIGHKLWIVMKGKRQFSGTLRGFDDFFNMVLENVTEIWTDGAERKVRQLQSMLLNGHDIAYMVPGENPIQKIESKTIISKKKMQQVHHE